MPLSFKDANKLYREAQGIGLFPEMDRRQFSQLVNSYTGSDLMKATDVGGFGGFVKQASGTINEALEGFGINEVGRDVGEEIGSWFGEGQVGRQVGETLPRSALNLAGLVVGGPVGLAATAGLTAADVYERTGEVDRAAFAGATSAAAPLVIGKLFPALAGAVPGGATVGQALTSTTTGGVASRFAGNLVEGGLFGVAQDVGDIALSEDRKFAEMKTKGYWVAQGIGSLAFAPFDLKQAFTAQAAAGKVTPPNPQEFQRQTVDSQLEDRYVETEEAPEIVLPTEIAPANVNFPTTPLSQTPPVLPSARALTPRPKTARELELEAYESGEKIYTSPNQKATTEVAGVPIVGPTPLERFRALSGGFEELESQIGATKAGIESDFANQPTIPTGPTQRTFTTAKGSEYVVGEGGRTTRNKAFRPEHGEADQGTQPTSDATIYLTDEQANALSRPEGKTRYILRDGKLTLAAFTKGRWGAAQSQRDIPYSTEPKVGLTPLELWKPDEVGYDVSHFGNKITKVGEVGVSKKPVPIMTPEDFLGAKARIDLESKVALEPIMELPAKGVENVQTQLKTVNEVRDMQGLDPVNNVDLQILTEKQIARGEDSEDAIVRAVQEVKNSTNQHVESTSKKKSFDPEVSEKARLFADSLEIAVGKNPDLRKHADKMLKLVTDFNYSGKVVDELSSNFADWYRNVTEAGIGSKASLDARIKKVTEQAKRDAIALKTPEKLTSAESKKKGTAKRTVVKATDVWDRVGQLTDENQAAVIAKYQEFVKRADETMTDPPSVHNVGTNILDKWLNLGLSVDQLGRMLEGARRKMWKEDSRARAKRGISDPDGIWSDRAIAEGGKMAWDEDPGAEFDAMLMNAAKNLNLFWNVPSYVVKSNGQMQFGKLQSDKNGFVDAKALENLEGSNKKPVKKGEVELWKQLVPEAWNENGKVNLKTLVEGLENAEPTVEVKQLGEGATSDNMQKAMQARHQLDTLGWREEWSDHYVKDVYVGPDRKEYTSLDQLPPEIRALYDTIETSHSTDYENSADAKYSWLGPKPAESMPGYVEGLVRLPVETERSRAQKLLDSTKDEMLQVRTRLEEIAPEPGNPRPTDPVKAAEYDQLEQRFQQLLSARSDATSQTIGQGSKYSGPHFGAEDTNVVAFYRGYEETGPNGEKVFHVVEVQSDWAQAKRNTDRRYPTQNNDDVIANHPLLEQYESLALKAAIQHAKDIGATHIALSDAETAMMTEGHDRAAKTNVVLNDKNKALAAKELKTTDATLQPAYRKFLQQIIDGTAERDLGDSSIRQLQKAGFELERTVGQEAGMRLHYDQTLPKELERLTNSKGQGIEMGRHREGGDPNRDWIIETSDGVRFLTFPDEQAAKTHFENNKFDPAKFHVAHKPSGSAVFNNKTSVSGRLYPLDNTSFNSTFLFGDNGSRRFGDLRAANQVLLRHGETPSNAQVLSEPVVRMGRVFEQLTGQDLSIGTIVNPMNKAGIVSGLALKNPLSRAVWLNPKNHPDAQGFVAAHEMLGHVFGHLAEANMISAKVKQTYDKARATWQSASTLDRQQVLQLLSDQVLPKSVKENLDKVMLETAHDVEESMSNLNALFAYGLNSRANLREQFRYIPQPLVDMFIDMYRFLRRMTYATKGYLGYRTMNGFANGEVLKSTREFEKRISEAFDSVVKENEFASDMMQRYDMLMPGGWTRFRDAGSIDASVLDFNGNSAVQAAADAMLLKDSLGKFAEPILHRMERYPLLRHLSNVMRSEQGAANALLRKGEVIMFGDGYTNGGRVRVLKDGGPIGRVIRDKQAFDRLNEIILDQNEAGFDFLKLQPGSAEYVKATQGLNPKQISDITDSLKRVQLATVEQQKAIIDSNHRNALTELSILIRPKLKGTNAEVAAQSRAIYDSYRQGRQVGNFSQYTALMQQLGLDPMAYSPWIEATVNGIAKKSKFFSQTPYFVTERRMKRFHVSYDDNSGDPLGRRDFHTETEAQAFVKEAQSKGWKLTYDRGGYRDMHSRYKNYGKGYDTFSQMVVSAENKALEPFYQQMLKNGTITKQVYDDLVESREAFHAALSSENIDAMLGTLKPNRKFRKGREDLNMLEQHMRYLHKLSKALPRSETNAEFRYGKMEPALLNDPKSWTVFEEAQQAMEHFRTPDTDVGRKITKGLFLYYMGMNVSSAAIEATQAPLNLTPKLVEEGAGIGEAYALPFKAASKVGEYNMTGNWNSGVKVVTANGQSVDALSAVMARAQAEGWIGLGLQQEVRQMDYETMMDLGNLSVGKNAKGNGVLATVGGAYMNLASKFYGTFAQFNERIAFISAFELKKKQMFPGKKDLSRADFEQLYPELVRIVTTATSNAGRVGRPTGWFANEGSWRTAAQMMYSLGSYNAGAMSNLWRYVRHGLNADIAGLTPQQQKQARKAAVLAFSSMVGAAGVVGGLPFAGPLMALLDNHTELEVEKNIRLAAYEFGKEVADEEGGTFVADFATHGLAYAMGLPIDVSQRVAMNGILGFNAYEGWSAKALLGPVGSVGQSLSDATQNVLTGDVTQGIEKALPPAFKHIYSGWANNGLVTDRYGKANYAPTESQRLLMSMGFQPRDVAAFKEAQRITYKASRVRQDQNTRLVRNASKLPPAQARAMIDAYAQENPGYNSSAGYQGVVDYLTRARYGYDPSRWGTTQDALDNMSILESFGDSRFRSVPDTDVYRESLGIKSQMGLPLGDVRGGLQQALMVDQLVQSRGLTVPAARAVVSGMSRPSPRNIGVLEAFLGQ